MTDGRTDRRTSCDSVVRAMHTRRAVKIENIFTCLDRKHEHSIASRGKNDDYDDDNEHVHCIHIRHVGLCKS